ncbi:MAG: molecular chaperone [Halodesulfurarchaeum sp.]
MSQSSVDPELARARANLYELLSRILDGDVDLLVETMETGAVADLAEILPGEFDTSALARDDLDREALGLGYDNLFDVPGPAYVPPFASGHATDPSEAFESDAKYHAEGTAGEILGEPAEAVAELYERAGFSPGRGDGIPDHVAAELEFMAILSAHQARLERDDRHRQPPVRAIQERHLDHLSWVDAFADEVAAVDAAEGVYAAVCTFASAFVDWDRRQLLAGT